MSHSEERFQASVGGLLDAFYVLDAERDASGEIIDFRFAELNELGAAIIGMERESILGRRLCELLPVNLERGYFEQYAEVVRTGKPTVVEASFSDSDGIQASWLQFQAVKLGDGVAIHTRDITAAKLQEAETKRLYAELRMIFNAVPSLIWLKDCENRIIRVNTAVAKKLGLPLEEIEGQSTEDLFPEEAAAYYRDDMAVIKSGEPRLGYLEPQTLPSGERVWLRTDKAPLFDADGKPTGILAVVSDVTAERTSALQAAVLAKAVEERQAMGRNLHDGIGQELTGVQMLIEKVRRQTARGEKPDPNALEDIANVVSSASTEVRRMISGLTPERIYADELCVALGQVSANVQTFYGVHSECHCAEVIADLDDETANHLLAIAQEAAINAAKHAEAGEISIELHVDEAALTLCVTDDGRGLSAELLGTDGSESTGRGMQILHFRATAIGAQLQFDAAPEDWKPGGVQPESRDVSGGGTRVCCILPR